MNDLPESYEDVQRIKYELWGAGGGQAEFLEAAPGVDASKLIVAEGDSWFDYLPGLDILDNLKRDHGYEIFKEAFAGDTLENMAFGTELRGNFSRRTPQLSETLTVVSKHKPKVFLLSGGGNDIAGIELEAFINHKDSGLPSIRMGYAEYMFFTVFKTAIEFIAHQVWAVSPNTHVLAHGYAYPIPDGRAVINMPLGFRFVGPWLRPALAKKNYTSPIEAERIIRDLIDMFNDMLQDVERENERFHYLDLRDHIGREHWVNELHLSNAAYRSVADAFHGRIQQLAR